MRVLMLGWEFPPYISGGLGTACYGLTRGLRASGVDVTFVIPHARGDEDARYVEVVGANRVLVPGVRRRAGPERTGPERTVRERARDAALVHAPAAATAAAGDETAATAAGAPTADEVRADALEEVLDLIEIDSTLRPYQDEVAYAERVASAVHGLTAAGTAAPPARTPTRRAVLRALRELFADSPLRDAVAAVTEQERGGYLPFAGGYGQDLMSEVARFALVTGELARTRQFDVVHAHDWITIPAGIVAARLAGKPFVLHVHASEYDRSGDHPNEQVRGIEQMGLLAADRVVCVSHYTASLLRRRYFVEQGKLRVVHNAVTHSEQIAAYHWVKTIPEPIVLFLGRITFQKGPDYFLEAAARVVQLEPNVKFVMSGSGDMLPRMIERAAQLGIGRHMHFTGFLRGKDVERMYAIADIYVMPSVSEPFGISPLEAMALDVPVIVSRQSGVAEVLTNALKVDFWDVQDMANKILALLRYEPLARQIAEDGKEEVRRLRWERQGRLMAQIYQELRS